ncbi:MAG TPA: hypothetical protein VGE63_03390 [Candidatus Paceibacterota bacterium]
MENKTFLEKLGFFLWPIAANLGVFMYLQKTSLIPAVQFIVSGVIGILLVLISIRRRNDELNESIESSRAVTIAVFATMLLCILGRQFVAYKPINLLGELAFLGVILIGICFIFVASDESVEKDYGISHYLSKSAAIFAVVGLIHEAYCYFGTQFIWVPLICFFCCMVLLKGDEIINDILSDHAPKMMTMLIAIGVVSTLYQFWFTRLFSGPMLWEALLGMATSIIIVGIFLFIARNIRRNEEKKRKDSLNTRKQEEDEKDRGLKEKKKQEDVAKYYAELKEESPSWDSILFIAANVQWRSDSDAYQVLVEAIRKKSLSVLITSSQVKEQMFWKGNSLEDALKFVNDLFDFSSDDETLKMLIEKYKEFNSFIESHKDLKGYEALQKNSGNLCSSIVSIAKKDVKKEVVEV